MGVRFEQELGARLGDERDTRLVRLRARREEQRIVGTEQLGDALLQPARRGIAVQDVIADLGFGHGAAHAGRRLGNGVGAKIDRGKIHPRRTRCRRRMRIRSYVSATSPPSRNT